MTEPTSDSSVVHPGPDVRPEVVTAIMQRVGVDLPPGRFVFEVARAYGSVAPTKGGERLELNHCDPVFQESIRRGGPASSALVLGCGEGLSGFDPSYARREFLGIWPATVRIEECALTPPMLWDESLWPRGQFDAVVNYLMVHYIYDIAPFFDMIRRLVRPGGTYVMAGHNAGFWRIPELRAAADSARSTLRTNNRWRRYLQISAWMGRARRLLGPEPPPDLRARVNAALANRLNITGELTFPEIAHLIDIHRPPQDSAGMQVGMCGFDVEHLTRQYLDGFRLESFQSRDWSGYVAPSQLPPDLRARDAELGRRYPDDGVFFAACWRRSH